MQLSRVLVVIGLIAVANACVYTCPDSTCAASLANCSCSGNAVLGTPEATFDRTSYSSWTVTNVLTASASASYAVASGNCSSFDFSSFAMYSWTLNNGSDVFTANGSSVSIPALTMYPGKNYNLTVKARGLLTAQSAQMVYAISAVAPTPTVDITTAGAELRVSSSNAVVIAATIVDNFPAASPNYSWTCAVVSASGTCPSTSNATAMALTIAAGAAAGTYQITLTYRTNSVSTMNLTVVAGAIPLVSIVQSSSPVVAQPVVYLSTQTINIGSAVTYSSNVTFTWTLGGSNSSTNSTNSSTSLGTSRVISVSAASLSLSPSTGAMVANRIVVRATDAADSTVYGEAAIIIYVLPAYDLTLTVKKSGDAAATFATALSDKLLLTASSSTLTQQGGSVPYGLMYQMTFAFFTDLMLPLATTISGSNYIAQAPIPVNGTGNANVVFQAQLRIGGVLAASTNATFAIARPNVATAADDQIKNAASITDPAAAVAAASNMQTLMASSSNATQIAELGSAAVLMLANSVTNFDSQSSDQQAAIFDMCTTAVGAQSSSTAKAELQAKTLNLMKLALASTSFSASNGLKALNALATLSVAESSATINLLATKLANDPTLPVGQTKTFRANGVNISAVRETASDLGGLSTSSGEGSSMEFQSGFVLPGVATTAVVSVSSSSYSTNPYSGTPEGVVATYEISADGAVKSVSGLSKALVIKLRGASSKASCRYWDTNANLWSTSGVVTKTVGGVVQCESDHLTAFATFNAASTIFAAVPLLIAVLGVAFQLLVLG
jgi:hypothetical protein